jgi:hypothetical protein
MEDIDDDFFSDDGFDDLPPDTLLQLEQDAFRATQVEAPTQSVLNTRLNWPSRDVIDRYPQTEAVRLPGPSNAANVSLQPPAQLHTGLTNDYGALDVGELDAEVFDEGPSPVVALDQTIAFSDRLSQHQDDTIVWNDEWPMQTDGGPSVYSALHKEYQLLAEKVV